MAKQYATEHGYEGSVAEAFIGVFIKNFEKGEKDARTEVAKNALALGLSIEQVSKISGLSVEEISKLV